jgi:DNA-binding XRE family transcriptional regulator
MMTTSKELSYWASLLQQIRETNRWTQAQLAAEIGVNRFTVMRWENETKHPSLVSQQLISELANRFNIESVYGLSNVIALSPFPMILTNRKDFVISASKISGFLSGKTVLEQTPKK